jgi:MYXO-CTERM domain-containing protein
MTTKVTKLAARAYLVLICTAAPVAMVHAQTGAAGGQGAGGAGTGTGTAGTVAGQPGGAGAGGTGAAGNGVGTAGAGNGSTAGGQGDLGYTQASDNNRGGGGSKAGWLGLLGLLGLLGMRRRDTGTTHVHDTAPSYETTGARRP